MALDEKERVLVEYRGDLMERLRGSKRPWKSTDASAPVLIMQIPYLWKTSIPYKWPELTSRPVQQVMGLYRDKRDTMEFIIEKQKLIHQISSSPLRQQREEAIRTQVRRHTSISRVRDGSEDYGDFTALASDQRAKTSNVRPLTRSCSVKTAPADKLPFEFSPGSKRKSPSPKRGCFSGRAPILQRAPSPAVSSFKPLDFLITKYSLPSALIAISQQRVPRKASSLTNKEIEAYLHRFKPDSSLPTQVTTSRTGFSGFKLTLKRPAEKKKEHVRVKRVNVATQASPPTSPGPHLDGELYLHYLQYKRECRSRAQSSI